MAMSYDRLCAENESEHAHFDPLALCPALRYPVPQVQQYAPCGRLVPQGHASSLDTDRMRSARAPTSTRNTGFCAIWACIGRAGA